MIKKRLEAIEKYFGEKYSGKKIKDNSLRYPSIAIHSNDWIGLRVLLDGIYEKDELIQLFLICGEYLQDKVVLDVGANIGNHTIFFADRMRYVYSFEPSPQNLPILNFNVRNHKNVKVINFGASNCEKYVTAVVPQGNFGATSISVNVAAGDTTVDFLVKPIDQLDYLYDESIGLIKVDVEGHELEALQGASALIKKNNPLIMFEQNRDIQFESSRVLDFLRSSGYCYFYEINSIEGWWIGDKAPLITRKIIRLFQILVGGYPEKITTFNLINKFEKSSYNVLLASKWDLAKVGPKKSSH